MNENQKGILFNKLNSHRYYQLISEEYFFHLDRNLFFLFDYGCKDKASPPETLSPM